MRDSTLSTRISTVFGLLLIGLLLVPAVQAEEEAAVTPSSLEAFEALYTEVQTAVAEGRLPAGTAEAAQDLVFDLKTGLIRSDAEIEILRLEAVRFDGERQQRALDRLIASAAARERQVIDRLRRLEELAAAPAVEGSEQPKKQGDEKGGLSVTFEPADLIKDPDS